jgi:hypothetical protein
MMSEPFGKIVELFIMMSGKLVRLIMMSEIARLPA